MGKVYDDLRKGLESIEKAHARKVLKELLQGRELHRERQHREICIRCGKPRVLGVRGQAKGKCKLCRKAERKVSENDSK